MKSLNASNLPNSFEQNSQHRISAWRQVRLFASLTMVTLGLALLLAADSGDSPSSTSPPPDATNTDAAVSTDKPPARLVSIQLPISGEQDAEARRGIEQWLNSIQDNDQRPTLIVEFKSPSGQTGEGSQFERSLSLARYLVSPRLASIRTVAYVPQSVYGHAVLPVLACESIVMHPDAELGAAGMDEAVIDGGIQASYVDIAERKRTIPVPVVLGMLDKDNVVYQAKTLDGNRYVDEAGLKALQDEETVSAVDTLIQRGDFGRITGRDLRLKYGFVSHLAKDHGELASALEIDAAALETDPSAGGDWKAVGVHLFGNVNSKNVSWVQSSLRQKLNERDINLICLQLDSPGGSLSGSMQLANYLASLDPAKVRTVCYIENEALADAALIALSCDQLVMSENAKLGGPGAVVASAEQLTDLHEPLLELADAKHRSWSLMQALLDDGETSVFQYTHRDTGEVRLASPEEIASLSIPDAWAKGSQIETSDGIQGSQAEQLNVAQYLAADEAELRSIFGLEKEPETIRPNWAHSFIQGLASPGFGGSLLFFGTLALISELMSPGLSVAGFISAVCFVLYFWSNYLNGTAGWLEVLLFMTGVVSIIVEIFFVPGFGIFGLGGGVLVIGSLVLASQTFVLPQNSYQMERFPTSLWMVSGAGAGTLISMFALRKYLPDAPIFRRMVLQPLEYEELDDLSERESLARYDYLMRKSGKTTTQLTPSGKARFGDDIINVISEGEVIPRGCDVSVIEVRGNVVVVSPIDDALSG